MSEKTKKLPKSAPDVGSKLYHVSEHLYYIPNHAGPVLEYAVSEVEVTGYFFGGYIEIETVGDLPGHGRTPVFAKLSTLDKEKTFRTAAGAAEYAMKLTADYENTWAWLGAPDIPLRRPWAHLLERK